MTRFSYLFFGAALSLIFFITMVSGDVPWTAVWNGVVDRLSGKATAWNPLLDERLPRWIVLACTGASLAVSGAVMQALFQNPLASPSVLGISCGGSLAVVLIFVLGWQLHYPYAIPIASVFGCLATLFLIYALTRTKMNSVHNLILTGIALSTVLLAIQAAILYAMRDQWHLIQTLTEWEAGSTVNRSWQHVHMALPLTIIGLWGCWSYHREIDLLSLGHENAANLGVEVSKVRWRLFLCVAVLTGGALAAVGIIAFFGLVLPHIIRILAGSLHGKMIPLSILGGATALSALDLILRIFQIHALSIGTLSAIFGGLFFIFLLLKPSHRLQRASG